MIIPEKDLLAKTGDVDYYSWNYMFPIKYLQKYRFRRVAKLLNGRRYKKLLEVGTGSGIFIPELSRHCDELYAIDTHSNFDQQYVQWKTNCLISYSLFVQRKNLKMNLVYQGEALRNYWKRILKFRRKVT